MAIATAGNLSITQSVVSTLMEGYDNPETGERETLMNAPTMFQAAQRVGHVIRMIHANEGKALEDLRRELRRVVSVRRPDHRASACAFS